MTPILPATLGLLGSGQLGRMFAIAARRLGYRVEVFSPDSDTPAGQVADVEWVHSYDDAAAIDRFAQAVDVVTLEFENIDTECVRRLEQHVPVRPGALTLHTAQHRSREKNALRKLGLTTAPFHVVRSAEELAKHLAELGEGILKTAAFGYDGKGQQRLTSANDAALVWAEFATDEAVLEGIVDFACEFSVIGVRGVDGEFRAYDPILNTHRHHILDVSSSPALPVSREVADRAIAMTETVMVGLETIGVLCVEFFLTRSGEAVINEIAPRPHNSGHLTIDAHVCCQFEQQVRAVCGLPLGSTEQRQPAAMSNLLGDIWPDSSQPNWPDALRHSNIKLHLYGKREARPGRKMGHLTALGTNVAEATRAVLDARAGLQQ